MASFSFLPMALINGLGADVQRPLATVIGGVILSPPVPAGARPVGNVRQRQAYAGAC